ncbi:metallophosphoesterase family protein [Geopseudomonas aromaticivorans]
MSIWFCGDPHGRFDYLVETARAYRPAALVLLGDVECPAPLDLLLRPILQHTEVWYIHGNHDVSRSGFWHNLHAQPERSLHARVADVAGRRIGGLGGTFDRNAWHPAVPGETVQNRESFLETLALRPMPPEYLANRRSRSHGYIYPDDYFSLAMEQAEILVCHEAPACHRHGFAEIDQLADSLGASQIVHGHHHETYRDGRVLGVGRRVIVDEQGRVVYAERQ